MSRVSGAPPSPVEGVEAGLEGLERRDPCGKRGLDLGSLQRAVKAARGDLHLGQFGHEPKGRPTIGPR
jgi:hypothetical protein